MKTLNRREWIAIIVGVFVVGFFFVFGQGLMTIFNQNGMAVINNVSSPQALVQDLIVGTGEEAMIGKRVTIHYTGRFVDGTVFDSSFSRNEPLQFLLGSGQVIKGLDQGIVGMRIGGKRFLSIPPELGYGVNGYGPIPANSTLMFEIELLRVE